MVVPKMVLFLFPDVGSFVEAWISGSVKFSVDESLCEESVDVLFFLFVLLA
jgi:hypothetical protein